MTMIMMIMMTIIILRAVKTVICVWIAASVSGVPYAVHTRTYSYLNHPRTGLPIPDSVVCTVAAGSKPTVTAMFEASTLVLFVCPIVLITVLYAMIGIKLRVTSPLGREGRRLSDALIQRRASTVAERRQHKSRINVIRMLGTSNYCCHIVFTIIIFLTQLCASTHASAVS